MVDRDTSQPFEETGDGLLARAHRFEGIVRPASGGLQIALAPGPDRVGGQFMGFEVFHQAGKTFFDISQGGGCQQQGQQQE